MSWSKEGKRAKSTLRYDKEHAEALGIVAPKKRVVQGGQPAQPAVPPAEEPDEGALCSRPTGEELDKLITAVVDTAANHAADRFAAVLDGKPRHPLAPPAGNPAYGDYDADIEFTQEGFISKTTMRQDILNSLQEGRGYVQESQRRVGYIDPERIGYPHYVLDYSTSPSRHAFAGRVLDATIAELDKRGYPLERNALTREGKRRQLVIHPMLATCYTTSVRSLTTNKDVLEVLLEAEALECKFYKDGNGHPKIVLPNGNVVSAPATTKHWAASRQVRQRLKKAGLDIRTNKNVTKPKRKNRKS